MYAAATLAVEDRFGSLASAAVLRLAAGVALLPTKSAMKHAHKGVLPRSVRSL